MLKNLNICISVCIGIVSLAALLGTSHDYGMVWDEGHTIRRERLLADWFSWLADPPTSRGRAEAFSRRTLAIYWPFSREEPDGHPPFYALLGLGGWSLTRDVLPPLTAYRFGPMILFAATNGVVFLHLKRRYGWLAGLTTAGAFLLMPRAFSHAHYAHYDMPVSCLWLLAQLGFLKSLESRRWIAPYGTILGLAAATKFTGWFAVAPAAAWVMGREWLPVLRRRRAIDSTTRRRLPGTEALLLGLPVAALTLVLIQPPWWSDPLGGIARFLRSNLTRAATKPIPTLYLGQVFEFALPWHNTLVLTAVTVPVLMLILGLLGIAASLVRSRSKPEGPLFVLSWAVLMVVRALPQAPGHDGIRLFLPSLLSLAVLMGVGASWLAGVMRPRRLSGVAEAIVVAALSEGLLGIVQLYPYTLSYYSVVLGGLPGAQRRGFELTYYWDTMGPELLRWVREQSRLGPIELGFPTPLYNIRYLRERGEVPRNVRTSDEGTILRHPNYVLQRREGVFFPYDRWIDREGRPIFAISRQGVDLIRVFPYSEVLRAFKATRDLQVPDYLQRAEVLHSRWTLPEELRGASPDQSGLPGRIRSGAGEMGLGHP
jgi:hypothetical protein